MPRPNPADDPLASLLLGKSTNLSLDDIATVVADAMKSQRREILGHVRRLLQLERVKDQPIATKQHNLHNRLVVIESAVRRLEKERPR